MKIVSSFVREQQRYSKNQLRRRFSFDDTGIEKFIKSLKSYGILKAVANSARQRELTDLMDEDIQVVEETAGNDDCLYVFTYVGVVTMGNRVIKSYPKYILSDNEPFVQMRQVVRVLERYNQSEILPRMYSRSPKSSKEASDNVTVSISNSSSNPASCNCIEQSVMIYSWSRLK